MSPGRSMSLWQRGQQHGADLRLDQLDRGQRLSEGPTHGENVITYEKRGPVRPHTLDLCFPYRHLFRRVKQPRHKSTDSTVSSFSPSGELGLFILRIFRTFRIPKRSHKFDVYHLTIHFPLTFPCGFRPVCLFHIFPFVADSRVSNLFNPLWDPG